MSCAICRREIDEENAPIIAMGGFGYPRCICEGCAEHVDVMNTSMSPEQIRSSMAYIAETMANNPSDDMVAHNAVKVMLVEATSRIEKIENGTYTEEESAKEEMLDIPEELEETEEDRELDRQDKVKLEKFDKIFNWVSIGIIAAAAIGIAIYFILKFI